MDGKKGEKYVFRVIPYIKGNRDGVEIYYRPDATISERHWYEKGIFKKAESYDTNGKWDWRRGMKMARVISTINHISGQ